MRQGIRSECIVARERIASAHEILPPAAQALLVAVARSDVPPHAWACEHGASPQNGIQLLRQALDEIAPIYMKD
jgi:hypothetical protein